MSVNTEPFDEGRIARLTARISELEAQRDRTMTALRAIAEGYPIHNLYERYIIVENPKFQQDNGSNPNLVIDAWPAP